MKARGRLIDGAFARYLSPMFASPLSALWLVRHGESAGNVARAAASASGDERLHIEASRDVDVPLSALGERQSRALGRSIARLPGGEKPTAALASPYLRARRTAELVLQHGGIDLPLRLDERLRERELGAFDRLTQRGIEKRFPEEAARRRALGKFYHRPPGGESWCDVILRLRALLETVAREDAGGRLLLVCHSAVILCFRYILEQLTEEQVLAIDAAVEIANCSLTTYAGAGGGLSPVRFNFVAPVVEEGAEVTTEPDAATPAQ